jgi:hypothetical protein
VVSDADGYFILFFFVVRPSRTTVNGQKCFYFFVLDSLLSLIIHQVTKTIPKMGNPDIKIYGNTAKKVEGSKTPINVTITIKYLISYLLPSPCKR